MRQSGANQSEDRQDRNQDNTLLNQTEAYSNNSTDVIWNIFFMAPRIKLIVIFSLTLERFH